MEFFKKHKKGVIFLAIAVAGLIFGANKIFFKKQESGFLVEPVLKGNVVQEVSESGVIKIGQDIALSFKNGGQIEKIHVKVGQEVPAGQLLAKLDTAQLSIQIQEAKANLQAAKAQAQYAQSALLGAQIALFGAEQNLEDARALAQISLANAYEDALNASEEGYLRIFNALDTVKIVRDLYFSSSNQEGINVTAARDSIASALSKIKTSLDITNANPSNQNADNLLQVAIDSLKDASVNLTMVRQMTDASVYKDTVSSAYKTSLDTHRTYINTSQAAVFNSQQAISLAKAANESNINTAQNAGLSAKSSLAQAKDNVDLYEARANQAQAQLALLENQMRDSSIYAIVPGKITQIGKKEGETVQALAKVFSFLAAGVAQIETDIYEEDVVKVEEGDYAAIQITAFPGKNFSGKVISINPGEKLINGVVYYEVTIVLEDAPKEIKPGMTADITIKTAQRSGVLIVSGAAVKIRSGKAFVQIVENGAILAEREIEIGLRGNNNMVEVVSGLFEGEQIAVPK